MLRRSEASWSYVIFQAHSKYHNTQVSSNPAFTYSTTNEGPDGSILTKLPYMTWQGQFSHFYIKSNSTEEYQVDVISTPYNNGGIYLNTKIFVCLMSIIVSTATTSQSTSSDGPGRLSQSKTSTLFYQTNECLLRSNQLMHSCQS